MVRKGSMRERPRRSMAHAITTSNFLRLASLSMASRPGRWSLPLGTADAGILVDLDDLLPAALGDRPKCADLVLASHWRVQRKVLSIRRRLGASSDLWDERSGRLLSQWRLCRPHPERRQAERSAGVAVHQVRVCDQPQSREGTRPD